MIGVFDSGAGGLCACRELRRLLPRCDILFLADRKNAPYGTKSPEELAELIKNDIKRLRNMGAEKILSACCTASSMLSRQDVGDTRDVIPIIAPAAACAARHERVTVIATEHTVRVSAFGREIKRLSARTEADEIPMQRLVALIEGGMRDGALTPEGLRLAEDIADAVGKRGSTALILGCTHFSHLENTFKALLPHTEIINPAKLGAKAIASEAASLSGRGRTIYTE